MSETADAAATAPAAGFRLRAEPPRVMRLSRKTLTAIGVVAGLSVSGALIYALRPASHVQAKELFNTDSRATADVITSGPKDYSQVPKLGPPLPGDLGRPILSAEQRQGGDMSLSTGGAPGAGAQASVMAEARQRAIQERDAARTSKLFLGGGVATAGGAGAAATADAALPSATISTAVGQSAQAAQDGQAEKRAFLQTASGGQPVSAERLAPLPSPYVVQAGSIIAAALITGIRSDLPGQITAQVTQNVYDSPTGKFLLIPQGSKLLGEYDSQIASGQSRLLLAWSRLILPDGRSIALDRQPGADASGYAGLEDRVNEHWGKLVKAAILSTLLSVGSEAGTSQSENNLAQALRSGAANGFSQTGQQIVSRELGIQPTLTIRPGYPVRVIVNHDLVLEPSGGS